MTIELVPLCTFRADLDKPFDVGDTPAGRRIIFETSSGVVEGERFSGKLTGNSGADWMIVGPDGIGTIDVRALVETSDGALVFVQYLGRSDFHRAAAGPIYIGVRFETSDERYTWLNRVIAVGKGFFDGRTLTYEVYEAR